MAVKKAFFFTMDSLLASGIIIISILLVANFYSTEVQRPNVNNAAQDIVKVFSSLKIGEVNNAYIRNLTQSGIITDVNNTILEQIGEFWAEGNNLSYNISKNLTEQIIPQSFGLSILVDGEEIYSRNKPITGALVSSRKIISGITKAKPTDGYTARAVLKGIKSKKTSSYIYFGGYEGDGNITKVFFLPKDVISINSSYLEIDSGGNFDLYINGIFSGSYAKNSAGGGNMLSDKWNISSAFLANFRSGENLLWLNFTANKSYAAGGFLKVTYITSSYNDTFIEGYQKDNFPGIKGVINIYSSFYVPGQLNYMSVFLNFSSNLTAFLKIGNVTVFQGDSNATMKNITLSNATLASMLDFSMLSQKTMPIRLGLLNATYITGNSDVMLVSDVSGSMEWCTKATSEAFNTFTAPAGKTCYQFFGWRWSNYTMTPSSVGYVEYNRTFWNNGTHDLCGCRYQGNCKNDSRKIDIYMNASRQFLKTLFNVSGNRMGIVEFSAGYNEAYNRTCAAGNPTTTINTDGVARLKNVTNIDSQLEAIINTTRSWHGTCICCGINKAVSVLRTQEQSKTQQIVLMSDGDATGGCTQQPNGTAIADAVQSAWDACNLNISVYVIGFGADANPANLRRMNCSGGKFYNASNATKLQEVFNEIALEISSLGFFQQTANTTGTLARSVLSQNSYMEFNFTPSAQVFNKLPLSFETERFGNNITNGSLMIYPNTSVFSARVTSYSGPKWTDRLAVNSADVFRLQDFGGDYQKLGDPFVVDIPVGNINAGNNTLQISSGTAPTNSSGGSNDNRAIYTLLLSGFADYSAVVSKSDGCTWQIDFEDGTSSSVKVPPAYSGADVCNFQSKTFDADDAMDIAAIQLFNNLDLDKDGKLDVNIDAGNLDFNTLTISKVPSLWGPAIVEIRIWE